MGLKKRIAAGLASVVLAVAVMMGFSSATAQADVLDDLAKEFSLGAGAGQVSGLVKRSLQLRNQGYRPSKANIAAINEAMTRRPHQTPLVEALEETVEDQLQLRQIAQLAAEQQQRQQARLDQLGINPQPQPGVGVPAGPGTINVPVPIG